TELEADFARGERSVEGKLTNVRVAGKKQDLEFQLRKTRISGNTYAGRVDLTGRNGVPSGAVRTSSIFSGAFYGKRAEGSAGTFHFQGRNVRLLDRRQQIEVVGTFGGNK